MSWLSGGSFTIGEDLALSGMGAITQFLQGAVLTVRLTHKSLKKTNQNDM